MATETGSDRVICYPCDSAEAFIAHARSLPPPQHRMSRAFLDGVMGHAVLCGSSAAITVGDFVETLGPANRAVAGEVLRRSEPRRRSGEALHAFVPSTYWKQCFSDLTGESDLTEYQRLDFGGLSPARGVFEDGRNWFDVVAIDEPLAERISAIRWAADAVTNFGPPAAFMQRGFGFAATADGLIVGVVGCFTAYSDGVEVQIDTHRDYRRRGVALALARRFIQEAARQDVTVYWDAMNEPSARLAGRLGFGPTRPYQCLIVP